MYPAKKQNKTKQKGQKADSIVFIFNTNRQNNTG